MPIAITPVVYLPSQGFGNNASRSFTPVPCTSYVGCSTFVALLGLGVINPTYCTVHIQYIQYDGCQKGVIRA
jgi:hypothetical protein